MSDTPEVSALICKQDCINAPWHAFIAVGEKAKELERERNDALRKLESYSDDCAMMDNLRKRLEYLSIEVSFANQKRDEWKAMSARLRDSLLDCQGHISGAHPHWKEACRAVIAYEILNNERRSHQNRAPRRD